MGNNKKATLLDLQLELWLRARENNHVVWITKEGKEIPINKMSTTHLINAIKMLERKADDYWDALEALGSIGDMDF